MWIRGYRVNENSGNVENCLGNGSYQGYTKELRRRIRSWSEEKREKKNPKRFLEREKELKVLSFLSTMKDCYGL